MAVPSAWRDEKLMEYYSGDEILRYFSPEEQERLRQEVVHSINHELVHPEDLETVVPKLHHSCEAEATELRRSMNSIVSLQIVEAQRALELVRSSSERVNGLRQHFLKQAELVDGLQRETLTSKHLRQLHLLRENISSVIRWATALKEVRYENLFVLVEKRQFALLYEKVKELQHIRRMVVTKAGARYRVFEAVFEPYFSKLDLICDAMVRELYTLLEEDGANIAIQKALMDSETEDPPGFLTFKECCMVCMAELEIPVLQIASEIPAAAAAAAGSNAAADRSPGITTEKLEGCVRRNILKLWDQQVLRDAAKDPLENTKDYFHRLKKVEPLIEALQLTLVPFSTKKFLFFDVVLRTLHERVLHSMQVFVENKETLDANTLLDSSQFIQWYKSMLTSYRYDTVLALKEVDTLTAVFMTTAVSGLSAHLSRLCRACATAVLKQTPSVPSSGRFPSTSGPVDLFAILQQTLGGLSTAIDTHVMEDIGNACVDAILAYLDTCKNGMDYDTWEETYGGSGDAAAAAVDEWQQRRLLLLYALCNDCRTVENNLDSVELKFAVCWDTNPLTAGPGVGDLSPAAGAADSPFLKIQEVLFDLSLYFLNEIHEQVERVMSSQWPLAFREGPWYDDEMNPVWLVLTTQAEYMDEEFKVMVAEPEKVRKLCSYLLQHFVSRYIATLVEFLADVIRNPKKHPVPDWALFVDNIVRDIDRTQETWKKRVARDIQSELLNNAVDAMNLMKELLCIKKVVDLEFLLRDQLLDKFGDCPTFVIQYVLESRPKEVAVESKERMMALWQDMTRVQQRVNDIPVKWNKPRSVFGLLDREIGQYYKSGGFFSKSAKKKIMAKRDEQVQEEKEKKRRARLAKAKTAAAS